MTTDTSTTPEAPAREPVDELLGMSTGAIGKTFGAVVDQALAGSHTAAVRNDRRPAVVVGAAWYNAQPGAHHHVMSTRGRNGEPLDRDDYAEYLDRVLALPDDGRRVELTGHEAEAVASVLDEVAAIYRGEALGKLARRLAVKLFDRAGV